MIIDKEFNQLLYINSVECYANKNNAIAGYTLII